MWAGRRQELSLAQGLKARGPGAARLMRWLAANDVDRDPGAVVYTQLCNARGGVEADVTVERFEVATPPLEEIFIDVVEGAR